MLIEDLVFLLGHYFPLFVFWLALPWLLPVCFLCFTPSFLPCIWSTHWTHLLFYFCHPTLLCILSRLLSHALSCLFPCLSLILPCPLPFLLALPFGLTCLIASCTPTPSSCATHLYFRFVFVFLFFFACYLNYGLDYCLSFELFPNLFSFIFSSCIVSCIALS